MFWTFREHNVMCSNVSRRVLSAGISVECLWRLFAHVSFDYIVGVVHDVSRQTEITDLGHSAVGEEDVSGRHVSVDALPRKMTPIDFWSVLD